MEFATIKALRALARAASEAYEERAGKKPRHVQVFVREKGVVIQANRGLHLQVEHLVPYEILVRGELPEAQAEYAIKWVCDKLAMSEAAANA